MLAIFQTAAPSVKALWFAPVSRDGRHCRFSQPLQASTPGLRRAQTSAAAQLRDSFAAFVIGLI